MPHLQKSVLSFIAYLIPIMLLLISSNSYAETLWTGTWNTSWQGGDAKMHLVQAGDKVTGTYTYQDGQISGEVFGNLLVGNWYESDNSGTFVFTMASDGASFSGVYDDDQWWNGTRDIVSTFAWTGTWNTSWQGGNAKMELSTKW